MDINSYTVVVACLAYLASAGEAGNSNPPDFASLEGGLPRPRHGRYPSVYA